MGHRDAKMQPAYAPLLSIVIPTRNRDEYAVSAIRSALGISDPGLEVVVQDSSDNDRLGRWLGENIDDGRLRYNYTPPPVSMTGNFNIAVGLARGEYVCAIGDDDGVNPEIVQITRWAASNGIEALLPEQIAHYGWPDLRQRYYGAARAGKLEVRGFNGNVKYVDAASQLDRCLSNAAQSFGYLPRIYYGIVLRSKVEQIRDRTGSYFPGISPDMALAGALACMIEKVCVIDYPVFLPGSSKNSNAGLSSLKKHVGRLEDQEHLEKSYLAAWSSYVPRFYSVQTIWAEALVEALSAMDRRDLLDRFNLPLLHSMCLVFNPRYASVIMASFARALRATGRSVIAGYWRLAVGYLYTWRLRARALMRFLPFSKQESAGALAVDGLADIEQAVGVFYGHIKREDRPPPVWQRPSPTPGSQGSA